MNDGMTEQIAMSLQDVQVTTPGLIWTLRLDPRSMKAEILGVRRNAAELKAPEHPKPAGAPPMRGLGDLVAKATSALGIKQKPGCGCKKRQEALNKAVPFKPGGA
jgi:hypothetical protein